MIGRTLVAVTALVITLPAATVAAASAHEPRRERQLQAELDAIVAAGSPGTILLDRHNGRTLRLASGYAVTDSDLPSGSGLGVQRWRPCGVAWGHSGNSPGVPGLHVDQHEYQARDRAAGERGSEEPGTGRRQGLL